MVNAILSIIPPGKVGLVAPGCETGTVGPTEQLVNSCALGFHRN